MVQLNEGDGAFYGPKIDISVSDALKRKFQCATLQVCCALLQEFKIIVKDWFLPANVLSCKFYCSWIFNSPCDLICPTQQKMKLKESDL